MTASRAQSIPSEVDVIVCGGGPVGLSAAYLLGRAGLRVALFEKRSSTTTLPKGQYVHASTAELFRQWGVWALLDGAGWSTESSNGQGFYVNVANGPVAQIRAAEGTHADYVRKWESLSPAYPRKISASDYESALRRQAVRWPTASVQFGMEVIDVEQADGTVEATVRDTESGAQRQVRGRYLIACDGAHSFIRSRIGRGQDHGPTFGNQVLVEFRAELDASLGKDGFFHSFVLHPHYAGWFGSKHPATGLWRYSFRHDEDQLPPAELVLERLRGALGMPDLPVEIVRFYRFDYTTGLLRSWREGNIFFAGDAAHWHSPWGGFGMNSGIQDANNLCWKLALVARGAASDALLDTYEVERKSKARLSAKGATYNSLHYQAIVEAIRLGEGQAFRRGTISDEAVNLLQQLVNVHGDNSVLHTGYQLGTVYKSAAVIAAEQAAPAPRLGGYTETTLPGVRAPHAWLSTRTEARVSTVDLWGGHFALVGEDLQAFWPAAAAAVCRELGIDVEVVNVSATGPLRAVDAKFHHLYGKVAGRAFLVRPDGFIAAWLSAATAEDAQEALRQNCQQLLAAADRTTVEAQ